MSEAGCIQEGSQMPRSVLPKESLLYCCPALVCCSTDGNLLSSAVQRECKGSGAGDMEGTKGDWAWVGSKFNARIICSFKGEAKKKKNPLVIMNFVLLRNIYECEETECVGCNRGNEWAVVQQSGNLCWDLERAHLLTWVSSIHSGTWCFDCELNPGSGRGGLTGSWRT